MKGKSNLGRVLLSVVIAITMVSIPASVFAAQQPINNNSNNNTNNNNNATPENPVFKADNFANPMPRPKHVASNADIYFSEDFSTFDTNIWSIANLSGDGNFSYDGTNGWMNWLYGTNNSDTENDYLNGSINLTALPTCVSNVNLEFQAWGDGANVWIEFDGNVVGNVTASGNSSSPTEANLDITGYATPAVHTLTFHVNDSANRNFSIDNIVISANYTTDIIINGIEGMTNGGRYNTFPKTIKVNVTNRGTQNVTDADFHLQIYKEQPYSPETYKLWDMEECAAKDWIAQSHDGDTFTWTWTTEKYHSPSHSFGCHPDSLQTYEYNSNDTLSLKEPFYIPTEVNGKTVHAAYVNFWYWVQGEFDGVEAIDYGTIEISNGSYTITGGPYYNSNGNWENDTVDISAFIGQNITITFRWVSDDYINYEGMYVDDVSIQLSYTSAQPLVFQGYKYTDIPAGATKTIQFPLEFTPEEDTTYFIQVYSDYDDCIHDNHGYGHGYADEINYTIWFGDVCDAAVTGVSVDRYVEMQSNPYGTYHVNIPINVSVYNNGTLTENVPVKVSAYQKITEKMWFDDVENGDQGYQRPEWGTSSHWNIVDFDFYSPYHAWYFGDPTTHTYGAGGETAFELAPEGTVDWNLLKTADDADVMLQMKWDLAPNDMIVPVMVFGNTYVFFIGHSIHLTGNSGGWQTIRLSDLLAGYVALTGVKNIFYLPDVYGPYFGDNFKGFGIGICGPGLGPLTGGAGGVLLDNIEVYRSYKGAEVWSTTYTVNNLAPGNSTTFQVVWNDTEYGDYIVAGNVQLACDQDSTNDESSALTTVQEHLFTDASAIGCDDNTYGKADDWHIVAQCSMCPQGHFWWNGVDSMGTYDVNRNDVLQIKNTFNFTGVTEAYFNFTTKYWMEDGFDFGYVEVSNDSGMTWFIVDEFTGNTNNNWVDISEHLVPGVTNLYSPYTDFTFLMPSTFFTANMQFRFRFTSDEAVVEKGWYIDDVSINANNGTAYNLLFSDDMEHGDANWIHMMEPYGCHWHKESTFGAPAPTSSWYWNGENRTWNVIGGTPVNVTTFEYPLSTFLADYPWWSIYNSDPTLADVYTTDYDAEKGKYLEVDVNGSGYNVYANQTSVTLPNSPIIELKYYAWAYSGAAGNTTWHYVEVSNATTTVLYNVTAVKSFASDTKVVLDISQFAGQTVNISFHWNGTFDDPYGYSVNVFQIADVEIWAYLPGQALNTDHYYNNVDEKLIFKFDTTHVYHATLEWDQNFSFADLYPDDYGVVEISTDGGNTWKALFIVQGNSGNAWSHMSLDISDYVGGDQPIMVRFRFISNDANTDYGWMIDNVSIIGWSDYRNPTATATLDPAQPDGNNGWYVSPVTVTLSATDNVKVGAIYYSIDNGPWLTYSAPFTINVDGEHTIAYYAVDEVGNPSATGTVSFKIDTTAPTATITFPEQGYIYLMGRQLFKNPLGKTFIIGGITFQATASDATSGVAYVKFSVNDKANYEYYDVNSPYQAYWNHFDLLPHKYTLTVTATDNAGNTGSAATLDFTHWL